MQAHTKFAFAPAASAEPEICEPASRGLLRRRWHRRQLNLDCMIEANGKCFGAAIRNISEGGALLDGTPAMLRGTKLRLTIPAGQEIEACVIWHAEGATGVKFDEQLQSDDPLLATP